MDVANSVRKAIDDWEVGDVDAAMLHACNAADGTAKKVAHPLEGNNARFSGLLRRRYNVLGPMAMPGIDLHATRFPVKLDKPKAEGGRPDFADIVYGIHRCSHGHGEALPDGFELFSDAREGIGTTLHVERGAIRLSDRLIFGLLAVAVLEPVHVTGMSVPEGYFLSMGTSRFQINDWWGRLNDFLIVASTYTVPSVTLDFSEWENSQLP